MPIEVEGGPLRVFSQDEFHRVDRAVMGIVFEVHNEFGRFLDEILFKREIENRACRRGIPTQRERRIWVRHGSFEKLYRVDFVFSNGVIFEAKTVESLAPAHFIQTLNYLLLAGINHGKLVNLRTERVQWEFVSTTLTDQARHEFSVDDSNWLAVNLRSQFLKDNLISLVTDWGVFLETLLYREALTQALGGDANVIRRIPVFSNDCQLGDQEVHLVTDDTAFAITAVTESDEMRTHLIRFLGHTRLNHLQWINFNRHTLEFVTLSK